MQERVLIVDDDRLLRSALRRYLQRHGFEVDEADSCATAEARMRKFAPQVAVVDYRLPDGEAIALLRRMRHIDPSCAMLVLTGYGTIDLAVRAVKEGATEFLTKPIDMGAVLRAIQVGLRGAPSNTLGVVEPLFGPSAPMTALRERALLLAESDEPVLCIGAEGTGRRTIARWIHASGKRATKPLLEVACADPDVERSVFGEGDDDDSHPGVLEAAAGGTLLLHDLGRAPRAFKAKLLLLLREGQFQRLGSGRALPANVRIMASAERDLDGDDVDRELAAFFHPATLALPPLRDRRKDIVPLARHLLLRLASRHGRSSVVFAPDAQRALAAHSWPGNVRELESALESALLLTTSSPLTAADLPIARSVTARVAKARRVVEDVTEGGLETLEEVERRSIQRALREEKGSVPAAARRLGVPRSTLYHRLKVLGLSPREPISD